MKPIILISLLCLFAASAEAQSAEKKYWKYDKEYRQLDSLLQRTQDLGIRAAIVDEWDKLVEKMDRQLLLWEAEAGGNKKKLSVIRQQRAILFKRRNYL